MIAVRVLLIGGAMALLTSGTAGQGSSYVEHVVGRESAGDYTVFNRAGTTQALGAYQFIPSTFAGLGYMSYTGGARSSWSSYAFISEARANGVSSVSDLRFTEAGRGLQDQAFHRFTQRNLSAMSGSTRGAIGASVSGVAVTQEGLLSNAHFLGASGLNDWVEAGFDASVLPWEYVTANGFSSYAELQNYLMRRMADAGGSTYTPGSTFAVGGGGAPMYEGTDGFPGLSSKRAVTIREVPPFHGQRPTLAGG